MLLFKFRKGHCKLFSFTNQFMLLAGSDDKENAAILCVCVCVNHACAGTMYGAILQSNLMESYKLKIFLVITLFVLVFPNPSCVGEA